MGTLLADARSARVVERNVSTRPSLQNVIILTAGQSGSSVLTALVARAGFWYGHDTEHVGYDTFENTTLVGFNRRILAAAGVEWGGAVARGSASAIDSIRSAVGTIDPAAAGAFVDECEGQRPWIWKDPRLCYTIHYWESYVDLSTCKFLVMGRDLRQAWSGHMIKGKPPIAFSDFRGVFGGTLDVAKAYVRERRLPHLYTTFEDLTVEPARTIDELNAFLGTSLTLDDLRETYDGRLGSRRWSGFDGLQAWARYQAHRWLLRDTVRSLPEKSAVDPTSAAATRAR